MTTQNPAPRDVPFADRLIGAIKGLFGAKHAATVQSSKIADTLSDIARLYADAALAKLDSMSDGS